MMSLSRPFNLILPDLGFLMLTMRVLIVAFTVESSNARSQFSSNEQLSMTKLSA